MGIVAGGGSLPRIVAQAAGAAGWRPVIVRIGDGLVDDWTGFDGGAFAWGRTGDAIAYMKAEGVHRLVFCGTISKRPDFRSLLPSLRTLLRLPAALRIVRGGDDRLLRTLSRYLEHEGFTVVAVQEIAPDLLTPEGSLARRAPRTDEIAAFSLAQEATRRLGELDIGQAAVASRDRVIALEGIEGTRAMLLRVAEFKANGRIGRGERCALVKSVKPQQDRRFDLPSIGLATIEEAANAGISAIGVTAGRSLILGIEDVISAADRNDMSLVGLADDKASDLAGSGEGR